MILHYVLYDRLTGWFVSDCPDNITLKHNASSYAVGTISPVDPYYNVPLYFNQTAAVAFECSFETIYSAITIFTWYVDGMMVKNGSRYLEYQFSKGEYYVECVAFYDIMVDSCVCERRSPISVSGKKISDPVRNSLGENLLGVTVSPL